MSVFIIQDKYEDSMHYISSHPNEENALEHKAEYEEMDRQDNAYEEDKYTINEREYCYSKHSSECGNCRYCICMLEDPEKNCPKLNEILEERAVTQKVLEGMLAGTEGLRKRADDFAKELTETFEKEIRRIAEE